MSGPTKPALYRDLIDRLVDVCHNGQGQIGARRARAGVWNANASAKTLPDQHRINLLLKRLGPEDRETLANILSEQVETGVFEALKALEEFGIAPFQDGYEGSPYNDFIGRLSNDWDWPEARSERSSPPKPKRK
jgi:hypothetical protein